MQESHHNAFLDIHLEEKTFKMCFRWRKIWCSWSLDVQSYLKGLWHASAHVRHLDLWSGEPCFQDRLLVKKSSFIDPETPEKAILSVFERYFVHFGSFKRHILYFCASIVEKIRSHWGEVHEGILFVVSVPTNGSNAVFNVVIWLPTSIFIQKFVVLQRSYIMQDA